ATAIWNLDTAIWRSSGGRAAIWRLRSAELFSFIFPVLSPTAASGLQTRAHPLADLQIGVEESSLPRYSDMEFGYGDLEIVRGSSGNLEIALSGMFFFFFYAPRFISYCCAWSPDQSATPRRSPDRRITCFLRPLLFLKRKLLIWHMK